jgi:hypothetical protein
MRYWLPALVLGVAAAFAASEARPDIATGAKAPQFEAKEFVNTSSVDLRSLKGRVVLLEIFRTW